MLILKLVSRRMAAKVFVAIGLGVGVALLVQARADSRSEAETLKAETRKWADTIVHLFIGAVEHSMLRGDGIKVKASLEELKARAPSVEVKVYDQRGIEVFGAKPPPPSPDALPAGVAAILADPTREVRDGTRVYRPVPNEARCQECHSPKSRLRGVIEIVRDPQKYLAARARVMSSIITAGFTHIMTARRSELLDDYFEEVERMAPSVGAVAVFNADAELHFGHEIQGLEPAVIQELLRPGATARYEPRDDATLALIPLPMQERCVACHEEDEIGEIRGVLAVSMAGPKSMDSEPTRELESVIHSSLRFIMLSELGRRIADFLDAVAETDAVDELALYDELGRLYWTTRHPEPSPVVAEVLASGAPVHRLEGSGRAERLLTIAPLRNKTGCVQCHGSDSTLRGAVLVSVSTSIAAKASEESMRRRTFFTGVNLLGLLFMLGGLLHYFVTRPVRRIGDVADEVGNGNLGVMVDRADPDGDEISRLGQRINEMVRGLRAKTHLEKFVSRGAAQAAAGAGLRSISRTGERRAATVLFSDIRGFTTYSESVAPENVVEMLNRLLRAQAEVVVEFGGDIDKYVGDELMAVFTGEDAAIRAVQCAVHMIDAVQVAGKEGEGLGVGIGISAGDVVYGAIGHEERMDFTVIGDVVNTGARLCSAAIQGEILISAAVRGAAGEIEGILFEMGEPLTLRGKREPFPVFKVRKRGKSESP